MKKAKVSVVKAEDYESSKLSEALEKGLCLLGGLETLIKPRSRIFVKINHLSPLSPPERGICTHPALTREVLRLLKEAGHRLVVGDDIECSKKDCFRITGYRKLCDELEIPLLNLRERGFKEVRCAGEMLEKTYISPLVLESDYVVNLSKLKTHSFTIFTGAVKNMFGVIPLGLRLRYHRQFIKNDEFSQMLVDIYKCVPPRLNIMDAVEAMEGEGPSGGDVRQVGLIIAGTDGVAVDAVAARIIGLDPVSVFTTYHAHRRGVGTGKIEEIDVVGEELKSVEVRTFKHSAVAYSLFRRRIPSFLYAYLQEQFTLTPEVIRKKCTLCRDCVHVCPGEAAVLAGDSVWINKVKCIHCMCCHEVCRFRAIKLKQMPLGRILRQIISLSRGLRTLIS
ncbi:MAG: DUF362 domain-containing protein [Candidatus Aminicenantales bacterium]